MKNSIIPFLFGAMLMMTIAATSKQVQDIIVRPSSPKNTIIKTFYDYRPRTENKPCYPECQKFINKMSKKGYVVDEMSTSHSDYVWVSITIIMVKY